ncbi:hypothetical protein BS50DRAFT_398180 [Corynespora cassiicola Philippines]|uniref:Uncharacterized protein n=1 Tax=Corynespora cassiicola Philippines TaxID=1448308 RepID=A0A2T2NK99_CORCC|nr:hypothetical protein BS50DRAFT_398180 [Corynespora cassiicola Philippines]
MGNKAKPPRCSFQALLYPSAYVCVYICHRTRQKPPNSQMRNFMHLPFATQHPRPKKLPPFPITHPTPPSKVQKQTKKNRVPIRDTHKGASDFPQREPPSPPTPNRQPEPPHPQSSTDPRPRPRLRPGGPARSRMDAATRNPHLPSPRSPTNANPDPSSPHPPAGAVSRTPTFPLWRPKGGAKLGVTRAVRCRRKGVALASGREGGRRDGRWKAGKGSGEATGDCTRRRRRRRRWFGMTLAWRVAYPSMADSTGGGVVFARTRSGWAKEGSL